MQIAQSASAARTQLLQMRPGRLAPTSWRSPETPEPNQNRCLFTDPCEGMKLRQRRMILLGEHRPHMTVFGVRRVERTDLMQRGYLISKMTSTMTGVPIGKGLPVSSIIVSLSWSCVAGILLSFGQGVGLFLFTTTTTASFDMH
jgi:hypothetical protein